ncbi:MAG TPA: sugar ABC transporter permease [Chthoniobacterales bacterium]
MKTEPHRPAALPYASDPERPVPDVRRKGDAPLRRYRFEFMMMLPALLLLAAISLFPFVYLIWMSLNTVSLAGGLGFTFVGLDNWLQLFSDPQVGQSWKISLIYFACTVGTELVLGIVVALALHALHFGRHLVLSLVLMPIFIAPSIAGLLGYFLVDPVYGFYGWVLRTLGIFSGNLLGTASSAMPTLILIDVWQWTPLIILIVSAGLASLPEDVMEAAKIDGATYFQRLFRIVLPLLAPIILIALLIRSMDAIRFFDAIALTTNGGPADTTKVVAIRLYETAFRFFHLGYAAAIGLTMLIFTIVIAKVFLRALSGRELTN